MSVCPNCKKLTCLCACKGCSWSGSEDGEPTGHRFDCPAGLGRPSKTYASTQPNNEADGGKPGLTLEDRMARTLVELGPKLERAGEWPEYNSLHEAWGVLAEEFDELFDHVKLRQTKRDSRDVRGEALDVAAVALRIAAASLIHGWVRK